MMLVQIYLLKTVAVNLSVAINNINIRRIQNMSTQERVACWRDLLCVKCLGLNVVQTSLVLVIGLMIGSVAMTVVESPPSKRLIETIHAQDAMVARQIGFEARIDNIEAEIRNIRNELTVLTPTK